MCVGKAWNCHSDPQIPTMPAPTLQQEINDEPRNESKTRDSVTASLEFLATSQLEADVCFTRSLSAALATSTVADVVFGQARRASSGDRLKQIPYPNSFVEDEAQNCSLRTTLLTLKVMQRCFDR